MNTNSPNLRRASPLSRWPAAGEWRYGTAPIVLHWALALMLSAMAGLGWYMMSIEDEPGAGWYFNLHKSMGLLVLVLAMVLARLGWRLMNRPQALPASVPRWQARLSTVTQVLLYGLMLAVPLAGYLGAAHGKFGVAFFGLDLPAWAVPDHDTAEQFFDIHSALVWGLVALVSLHALGALKHLFIDRDGVFQRMWFKPRD